MKFSGLGLLLFSSVLGAQVPQSKHLWMITEENHSYEAVIGNSEMPYLNSLAAKYGLATQYYSEQHNSLSALMWLVAGKPITSDDNAAACFNVDNIARHLIAQGLTWRSYQEDLPYPGFSGLSNLNYVRRHNPIIDFTDTCALSQAINSVPFTQLATDIANHATPNYAYLTPNLQNDAHDGTLASADYWLSQHVPAILDLPEFQPGGDGILFLVFDEGTLGGWQDNRCTAAISNNCGGHVAALLIGPQVKPGYKSAVRYDHANLLRTICDGMGFSSCPGAGAVANPMSDFFNVVNIATPFANATVASPVRIQAVASNRAPVSAMQIYVDNALKYQTSGGSVNTQIPMSIGKHYVVVQAWDTAGGIHKRGMNLNVQSQAVVVKNPTPNSVVPSTVQVGATAIGRTTFSKMQLYVDGDPQFQNSGNTLNASVSLSAGTHALAVEASNSSGSLTTNKFFVTSASPAVHILSPAPSARFYAPLYVSATTVDPTPVTAVQIYVDNALAYQVTGSGVQAALPIASGRHSVVVQEWNASGATYKKAVAVDVLNVPITFSSPIANATVSSPVKITAAAPGGSPVQTMQIYIDGALAYQGAGQTVSTSLAMSSGKHYLVAKGWDTLGNNWYTGEYINVQ